MRRRVLHARARQTFGFGLVKAYQTLGYLTCSDRSKKCPNSTLLYCVHCTVQIQHYIQYSTIYICTVSLLCSLSSFVPVSLLPCPPVSLPPCPLVSLPPCPPVSLQPCPPVSLPPYNLPSCLPATLPPFPPVYLPPYHPVFLSPYYPATLPPC